MLKRQQNNDIFMLLMSLVCKDEEGKYGWTIYPLSALGCIRRAVSKGMYTNLYSSD